MVVCSVSGRRFVANYSKPEVRQAGTALRVYEDISLVQKVNIGNAGLIGSRVLTPLRSP